MHFIPSFFTYLFFFFIHRNRLLFHFLSVKLIVGRNVNCGEKNTTNEHIPPSWCCCCPSRRWEIYESNLCLMNFYASCASIDRWQNCDYKGSYFGRPVFFSVNDGAVCEINVARVYVCSYHSTMFWDKRSEKFAHTNTRLLKLMYIFILIIILLLLNPLSSFFSLHLTYMSRVILWPRERFLIKQIISARTIAEYWGNGCLL